MKTAKENADEVVRLATQHNKIAEFAMSVLKMDERRADVFVKACGDRFEWSGFQLEFKSPHGNTVAIDDPQCKGFFEREYDFLVPKQVEEKRGAVDPALIERAKTGNVTARGALFKALHGDRIQSPIENAKTMAELEGVLKNGVPKNNGDGEQQQQRVKSDNPWSAAGWNVTNQGRIAKSNFTLAESLARSAGSYIGATKPARAA